VPLSLPVVLWLCIALVAVSQVMILRSTVRAMRAAESEQARRGIEWAYAVVPAIALVLVLVVTWQAASDHASRLEMEAKASQTSAP
jgi:heme/copper-type cytochrome/quinol oxidase subunit 2